MTEILILYYSRHGHCRRMAEHIMWGAESVDGVSTRCRTVPEISDNTKATQTPIPDDGPLYATLDDVSHCNGLIMGSPCHFGNMAAPLKYFLDQTSGLWLSGAMANKPAAVFTSSSSLHGGQESTLLTMILPLLHHGMLITGLPYTNTDLLHTQSGGSPYGATHLEANRGSRLSDEEIRLCESLGRRVAQTAKQLAKP